MQAKLGQELLPARQPDPRKYFPAIYLHDSFPRTTAPHENYLKATTLFHAIPFLSDTSHVRGTRWIGGGGCFPFFFFFTTGYLNGIALWVLLVLGQGSGFQGYGSPVVASENRFGQRFK